MGGGGESAFIILFSELFYPPLHVSGGEGPGDEAIPMCVCTESNRKLGRA